MTKAEKAAYDREYRKKNFARIKARKAAYFQRTYDPVKAAKERKKNMSKHVQYCQQPWYKEYKRRYDKERRAKKFGEFKDAHSVLLELIREIHRQMPDRFERYAQAQRHGWSPITHQRRRQKRAELKINADGL